MRFRIVVVIVLSIVDIVVGWTMFTTGRVPGLSPKEKSPSTLTLLLLLLLTGSAMIPVTRGILWIRCHRIRIVGFDAYFQKVFIVPGLFQTLPPYFASTRGMLSFAIKNVQVSIPYHHHVRFE